MSEKEEPMTDLSIGDVARRAGLRPSAIRYYESVGLLPKPARQSGRRRYGKDVLVRLAAIRFAQTAGFTVEEIRKLLYGYRSSASPSARWRDLASRKIPEIDELIGQATKMKRILEMGLQCRCRSLNECIPYLKAESESPSPRSGGASPGRKTLSRAMARLGKKKDGRVPVARQAIGNTGRSATIAPIVRKTLAQIFTAS